MAQFIEYSKWYQDIFRHAVEFILPLCPQPVVVVVFVWVEVWDSIIISTEKQGWDLYKSMR